MNAFFLLHVEIYASKIHAYVHCTFILGEHLQYHDIFSLLAKILLKYHAYPSFFRRLWLVYVCGFSEIVITVMIRMIVL